MNDVAKNTLGNIDKQANQQVSRLIQQVKDTLPPLQQTSPSFKLSTEDIMATSKDVASSLKKAQLDSLEQNGVFPLLATDITKQIDKVLKGTTSDTSKAVLQAVKDKILSKTDENANDLFLTDEEKNDKKKDTFIGSITFAVVFATIIHVFVTQPFGIPTGSMERTLLVGDFLFVNKWSYGYRLPMRPVAIPFLQGTIMDTGQKGNPKDDPKSYVDAVKLPYTRILQFNKPQKNDVVVFNYPQDSVHTAIDRKDPYVKRCVATAGDTFEMRAGRLFVNGKPETVLGDQEVQHAYVVNTKEQLDIPTLYKGYGFLPVNEEQTNSGFRYTFQGLTNKIAKDIKELPSVIDMQESILPKGTAAVQYKLNSDRTAYTKSIDTAQSIFPVNKAWNPDWYGPVRIPKKGDVVVINQETLPMYQWIISEYEHNSLEKKNGKIFINGKEANQYTIQQDYYMMIGDNRDASLDARFFGFVPEENIVGKPMFTWMSLQGAFSDSSSTYQAPFKIRWERMFKATNTGEANKTSYWWIAAMILILFFGWDYFMKLFRKKKTEE
ncbi:signal peptidase I [Chryseobacterium cucumeris]|uniref:signal peptidase I n=1 Tax=Chryseobacterium cucumeris TaxID=1813611 RepID=UPI0023F4CE26|nr:signal peptidase I [Chryseobacterium cucumeris]